jgi:heme-degrading monooxygenase HmoA
MIARMWHGMTRADDAAEYLAFLERRAVPDYRSVPGNLGVQILHRIDGERAHFVTLTWWASREAIAAFAGADVELAKYYPEDERFLLEKERTVTHWEVSGPGPVGAGRGAR